MIDTVTCNYRLKKNSRNRKAIFITFIKKISNHNILECSNLLNQLINENYDAYIFNIKNADTLSTSIIKLLLAFQNTNLVQVGILTNSEVKELVSFSKLDDIFVTGDNTKTLLAKLEKINKKQDAY
ncbi:MAG TPA: hypothetical protein ENI15_07525 [Spirochaetes bacterium]|nr:hypothetical protein [Spirochaetota bacterium]